MQQLQIQLLMAASPIETVLVLTMSARGLLQVQQGAKGQSNGPTRWDAATGGASGFGTELS